MPDVTLYDVLAARACGGGGFVFLSDGARPKQFLSFAQLHRRATAIARDLEERGLRMQRALLLYPPGLEYIEAFFGCLYAGVIAVPAYPLRANRSSARIASIVRDADPAAVLTTEQGRAAWNKADLGAVELILSSLVEDPDSDWTPTGLRSESIAFLQYTSGSTGDPKGVIVTHANLIDNLKRTRDAFGISDQSVVVSWLPLYHDMGLIGSILQTVNVGCQAILLSHHAFLQQPSRWLEAISQYKGTISGGPNFAYDLCLRSISPSHREDLDLRSWEVAYCGAEPVNAGTLAGFAQSFVTCGFKDKAFFPCYGLAESTLFVSGGPANRAVKVLAVNRALLERERVQPSGESGVSRGIVSCGKLHLDVAIVDPETRRDCPTDRVGEIWIAGPSVAQGYWNKPDESELTFRAKRETDTTRHFLQTGDLGFIRDGELFVTGRLKDLIILRGRNHYPQDIERTSAAAHGTFARGQCAAFAVATEASDELTIVQEIDRHATDLQAAIRAIREAVIREHEVEPGAIILVARGAIPKTSSGKIQRGATRAALKAGGLRVLAEWNRGASSRAFEAGAQPLSWSDKLTFGTWLRDQVEAVARMGSDAAVYDLPLESLALDSLRAAELQSAITAATGVHTDFAALWSSLTISQLADRIWASIEAGNREPESMDESAGTALGPSYGQRALLFLCKLAPENSAYHIVRALRFRAVDPALLNQALQMFVERHAAFRTAFRFNGEEFEPFLFDSVTEILTIHDAREWADIEMAAYRQSNAAVPFQVDAAPLFRANLYLRPGGDHVLQLVVHHAIADLWSLEILLEEVLGYYAALENEALAPSYAPCRWNDFVSRERRLVGSPQAEKLKKYWSAKLSSVPPPLDLPADRPRPALQRFAGARLTFDIEPELSNAIRAFAGEQQSTPFAVFLAAFSILLSKYANQSEFVIGCPGSNRNDPVFAQSVGYFVNPLPLRMQMDSRDLVHDTVRRASVTIQGAVDHQELPFPLILEELAVPRNATRSPLFDVMIAWLQPRRLGAKARDLLLGAEGPEFRIAGIPVTSLASRSSSAQFDVTLVVAEGEAFRAAFEYNTDLFDEWRIHRAAGHLRMLLRGIVESRDGRVDELQLLDEAERKQLLLTFNMTAQDYGPLGQESIQAAFEREARAHPESVALIAGDQTLTYGEVESKANQLARWLQKKGAGPEQRVGVCLERSAGLIVSLLGVLKAGAAYVPLDPGSPLERLAAMCRDAGVRTVVTTTELASYAPAGVDLVSLDQEASALLAESTEPLRQEIHPDTLAYVIFTSGSTGTPKGVMVAHRGVVNRLVWGERFLELHAGDCVVHKTPYSFDVSVWEMFSPLRVGARLLITRPGGHQDSRHLAEIAGRERATVMHFVPSMLEAWLEEQGIAGCKELRKVVCSGEALPARLAERFRERLPEVALYNLYGPTEASIEVTGWKCGKETYGAAGVPIGTPIGNMKAHVLDPAGEPTPVGVGGELYLGGVGLARGYAGRPDLTAERFVPDPFFEGGILYRTGDRARYREDGAIEYLGRLDNQVKIRGFRVELGEIEAALREVAGVREAAAALWERPGCDQRLIAYVSGENLEAGAKELGDELRQKLSRKLPPYMVPQHFIALERMPLNANGKLDRRALPTPVIAAEDYASPRTELEESLAEIFAEVLQLPRVGIHDDFFQHGGHSLLAIRVQSRVNRKFGVDLPLSRVFEAPTPELLAAAVGIEKTHTTDPAKLAALLDELEEADPQGAPIPV
jgi:amino acid adenylation domain-containing protein